MEMLTLLSKLLLPSEVFEYFMITQISDNGHVVERLTCKPCLN